MTKPSKIAVIFLNGKSAGFIHLKKYLAKNPLLIGCDGGTQHIINLELKPHVIIGDFDSSAVPRDVPSNGQETVINGITYIRYPTDKNSTDSELAIRYAVQTGCDEIILSGTLGGRLDHLLGNILLLSKREFAHIKLRIIEDTQEAFMIRGSAQVHGKKGDLISFMPIAGYAVVASSSGLVYDLSRYNVSPDDNLGISNVMLSTKVEVIMSRGALLVIHQL